MIKLKKIIKEDLPNPLLDRVTNWKNSLEIGQLVVKDMGRLSSIDEIYQFVSDKLKTNDYSNTGQEQITVRMSKVGIILYDDDKLMVNLYSDEAQLKPIIVKLDSEWRNLLPEEKRLIEDKLDDIVPFKKLLSVNTGRKTNKTFRQVIEKNSKTGIKF